MDFPSNQDAIAELQAACVAKDAALREAMEIIGQDHLPDSGIMRRLRDALARPTAPTSAGFPAARPALRGEAPGAASRG